MYPININCPIRTVRDFSVNVIDNGNSIIEAIVDFPSLVY